MSVGALLLAAGGLTACSSSSDGQASASTLQEGDCVLFTSGDDGDTAAETVACQDPHFGEVVLSSDAFFDGDDSLPDDARMTALADTVTSMTRSSR